VTPVSHMRVLSLGRSRELTDDSRMASSENLDGTT
jgi:hypothetical protein